MSTAISTVKASDFPILDVSSDVAAGLTDPNREPMSREAIVSVPVPTGGSVVWSIETDGSVEASPEIRGILVLAHRHGVIWPSATFSGGGSRPVVETYDLVRGIRRGDDVGDLDPEELDRCTNPDGSIRWKDLAYTQPGSGPNGRGCRARESRVLYVLRPGDIYPVKINAGPGSLPTVRPFLARMALPTYRHVVSFTLKKVQTGSGISYAQIVPKVLDKLSADDGEKVRQFYTLPLLELTGMGAGETDGGAASTPADVPF
jgi:hypothetical protein